jgi:hypothetical protein
MAELCAEGMHYGRHKVARLMRFAGLYGCPQRRFKVTTQSDPSHPEAGLVVSGGCDGSVLRGLVNGQMDELAPGHFINRLFSN